MIHSSHICTVCDSSSVNIPSVNCITQGNSILFYLFLFIFNLFSHLVQFVFDCIDKDLVVNVVITETAYFSILSSFRCLNTAIMSIIKCRLLYGVLHLCTILSFFRSYNDCRSCKKIQHYK